MVVNYDAAVTFLQILHRLLQQLEDLLKALEWKSLDIVLWDILPMINFTLSIKKLQF